jgi:Cu2+-exporting ATPase
MSLAAAIDRLPGEVHDAAAFCPHCGASVGTAGPGGGRFCCAGCAGAYRLVEELGLGQYYARRTAAPAPPLPAEPSAAEELAPFAAASSDGSATIDLLVDGLRCAACVWLIETALRRRPEVIEARVNLTGRRLHLRWRGEAADVTPLARLVTQLGYRVAPFAAEGLEAQRDGRETELLRALGVAGFATANVMLLSVAIWSGIDGEMGTATRDLLHWLSALVALPAIAYAGWPFFRSALSALRAGRTNMDVPISIGVLLAAGMSLFETMRSGPHAYFDSAITLLFFLLVGRYLDLRARGRARSAAEHLLTLGRAPATLIAADGSTRRVPATSLAIGDAILVAAGERIAADGRVIAGCSSLDKSLIDGESLPLAVAPGAAVHAGTLNLAAPLQIEVSAVGERTLLAEIRRLVEAAEQDRARYVILADRVARLYAPAVHLMALATFVGWAVLVAWQEALLNAVAVLIITCPCALGLAVPVVQVIASGRLMRRGILLKSATALERLAAVDTIVFDKTGTLTLGRPELIASDSAEDELHLAAALGATSRHPLSQALVRACPGAPPADGVRELPGQGLACDTAAGELRLGNRSFCGVMAPGDDAVDSLELWLARPGRRPCRFRFADAIRPDAAATIAALRGSGKRILLLSGDRNAVVAALATTLGIPQSEAGLLPADKLARLHALAAAGARVMMIGDGLNDAPALAAAAVSMSPSTAADISQNAADVVFRGASLDAVREVLAVARRSGRLVRQNIGLAIAYNAFAVPLAMLGHVTPLVAAIAMSSSSLLVVGNALRLGDDHSGGGD